MDRKGVFGLQPSVYEPAGSHASRAGIKGLDGDPICTQSDRDPSRTHMGLEGPVVYPLYS